MPGNAGELNSPKVASSTSMASTPSTGRLIGAGIVALATFMLLNFIAAQFLNPMSIGSDTLGSSQPAYDSFYDGCVALLALALPAFLGGLLTSRIVGASAQKVSVAAFGVAMIAGLICWKHPYWRIPPVSGHSIHSAFMHYMLSNPIVILAFGTLGGWLGGEFASGRFVLDDREKPYMPGMEED